MFLQGVNEHFHTSLNAQNLPNITSLGVHLNLFKARLKKFSLAKLPGVKSLVLSHCYLHPDSLVYSINLTELVIQSCEDVAKHLDTLLEQTIPSLEILVLNDCELDAHNLYRLAEASQAGRLPNLRHLDLSDNKQKHLKHLFENPYALNELHSLHIRRTFDDSDIVDFAKMAKCSGIAHSLQELGVDRFWNFNVQWPQVKTLCLFSCSEYSLHGILDAVDQGFLPVLNTICVEAVTVYDTPILRSLMERNINLHRACSPWGHPFASVRCHCNMRWSQNSH